MAASCPFSWSAGQRLDDARRQAAAGRLDPAGWHPCHQTLTVAAALRQAAAVPPTDELVVCHGDACAPNTLLDADGRWAGHVDLGLLGVADRWADLAVATWSAEWNYGPGWEGTLLEAYGGFEIALTPAYDGGLGRAWLSGGGAYVLANIRGGGELPLFLECRAAPG